MHLKNFDLPVQIAFWPWLGTLAYAIAGFDKAPLLMPHGLNAAASPDGWHRYAKHFGRFSYADILAMYFSTSIWRRPQAYSP
jgi:hypothetical protein